MELRARLRQTGVAVCAATALGLSLWSCGRAGPGSPTLIAPGQLTVAGPTAGASSPLTGATITWSCMTAGTAGIFSSATGCTTATGIGTSRAQGRVTAFAAPGPSGNLAGSVSGSTVTLTWLAPTSADPATSYLVEAGSSPGAANLASFDTGSAATALTATAVPSGVYYVRVRAKNSTGTSAPSNEIVLVVGSGGCATTPGAPTGLTGAVSGATVTLTWAAPVGGCSASSYVLQAGSSSGLSNLANTNVGSAATTYVASGVGAGTYYVRVLSANGNAIGPASNEIIVTVGSGGTLTGRWIGLAPDGVTFDPEADAGCDSDLQLDLTQVGTALSGTIAMRIRALNKRRNCGQIGDVLIPTLTNGTASGTGVSFGFHEPSGRFVATFSGSVSGNRMSGVVIGSGDGQPVGTFAVTRQ